MKTKQLFLISSIALLTACNLNNLDNKKTKYKSIVKEGTYKLMVPDFVDSTTKLHKEASLQYANLLKEFYILVIKEDKENLKQQTLISPLLQSYFPDSLSLVQNYFNYITSTLSKKSSYKLFDTVSTTIKKSNAKVGSVTVSLDNKADVFYRIAAIEANKNIYQIYTWTLRKYQEKHKPIMDSVINSLKEF